MLQKLFKGFYLKRHSKSVEEHYHVLNDRYIKAYGDIIEASRTENPEVMLDYLGKSMGLKDGQKVLDAGCGICGPARYFAGHYNIAVEAMTVSPKHVEVAKEWNKEFKGPGSINVQVADFHFLSDTYPANAFDVAYFLESFCHSYDPLKVIDETKKVLKPGGAIYLKEWFLSERMKQKDPVKYKDMLQRINNFYRFNLQDGISEAPSIAKALEERGFKVEFCRVPAYETGNYELTAIFHGHNDILGPNDYYKDNWLGGELPEVFDVIEIFEIKAVKQ